MNLYWIIGLAAFVLLEKSIPMGHWLGNLVGIALIAWGTAVLAGALPLRDGLGLSETTKERVGLLSRESGKGHERNIGARTRGEAQLHAYLLASPPRKKLGQTESGFGCVSTESGFGGVSSDCSAGADGFVVRGGFSLPV